MMRGTASSGEPSLTLTAINNSTVPGRQYFNVFPAPLHTVSPPLRQTLVPLVSGATATATEVVMSWATPTTLPLQVVAPGQSLSRAPQTPVAPGSTTTIAWAHGAFTVTTAVGTGSAITLVFSPGIPTGSKVGLTVGPGTILIPISADGLEITPNLVPTYSVQFGTAWQPDAQRFSNNSPAATITFAGPTASIEVGPDNVIVQTA